MKIPVLGLALLSAAAAALEASRSQQSNVFGGLSEVTERRVFSFTPRGASAIVPSANQVERTATEDEKLTLGDLVDGAAGSEDDDTITALEAGGKKGKKGDKKKEPHLQCV